MLKLQSLKKKDKPKTNSVCLPLATRQYLFTALLLVVSIFAFATLAIPSIPFVTTYTVTQKLPQVQTSHSYYVTFTTVPFESTTVEYPLLSDMISQGEASWVDGTFVCASRLGTGAAASFACDLALGAGVYDNTTVILESSGPSLVQASSAVQYTQTMTSLFTPSSTALIPAAATVGLTDGTFYMIAILVIGLLAVLTAWLALRHKNMKN